MRFRLRAREYPRKRLESQCSIVNPPAAATAPMPNRIADEKRSNHPPRDNVKASTNQSRMNSLAIPMGRRTVSGVDRGMGAALRLGQVLQQQAGAALRFK